MTDSQENSPQGLEIPLDALSPEALTGIVDEFVLREGTDYGANEISHHAKFERVKKQIASGDVKIIFDFESESVTLKTRQEWQISLNSKLIQL